MARLVYEKGTSSKFWEGTVDGGILRVRFGRIGTDGQVKETRLASPAAAREALAKVTAEKTHKGYVAGKGKSPKAKVKPVPGLPAAKATALITLARKLGGAPVAAEVGLAAGDPVAYLAKFSGRAARRR